MFYGVVIGIHLNRELSEDELRDMIQNLWSFKKHCRQSGKLRGMPNFIFNLYDETEFNEANSLFGGALRIYAECDGRTDLPVEDIGNICAHYDATIVQLVRKLIV